MKTIRLLLASAVLASSLEAQQPAAPSRAPAAQPAVTAVKATKGPTVEGITEYTLPNGLRFLLFPDASKPTGTVNMTYLVGSRHEGYGETGMAHLLEHMVFKGTPKHKNIPQELTERGTRPNGTTWYDRTNYFETFPASSANLEWALDLESDRMVNSFIARKDLESEMTVVRNEFEMGENSPQAVLEERVMSTAYLWHNYGKSTIGARADIENVPIERLQGFYRKYYQPDNALLVVAGKFDEAQAIRLIEQKFGAIPRPVRTGANTLFATYTAEPTQDGERNVTLRRVGDIQVALAMYHVPSGTHEDFAAVDVLSEVLGAAPAGRLYKALVETKKAANVSSFAFQLKEPGVLEAVAEVRKDGNLDDAQSGLVQAVEDVASRPPTTEEVERAKATLLKNIELNLNTSDRIGLELSEWASMGDWRMLFIHRDRIKRVDAQQVQRVATAYLKPSNRTLGLFVPTQAPVRAEIPPVPDVVALVKDYKGDTTLAVGEAFDPSVSNIESRLARSTLPSGLKLMLLPKKTRGAAVVATLAMRYGSPNTLANRATAGTFAGSMLLRGTKTRTRQQIKDEFDRLKARVSISGSAMSANATIETTRENLPAVLRLVAEVLREPAFDPKEFDQLKQERLAALEESKPEPTMQGSIAYSRAITPYPKGHPRYVETIDETIANVTAATLDDVKKFHADFYGVGGGELAIVGDFDAAEVGKLAGDLFGAWKSPQAWARVPETYTAPQGGNVSLETPDKANAFFIAGMRINMRNDDPDYPALVMANYMLGGGFLNSRLAVRIRQKDGLSYGVGSGLNVSTIDSTGSFTANAIYAPENATKLEAAFKEEMARALKDGFTADELSKAQDGYLQSRQVSRAQDRELTLALSNAALANRTLAFDATLEGKIAALTTEQVAGALRKYIDLNKLTIVKAGDFAKAKKAS
ncbi:MAG: insulinase family protein [Gemmatimonadetes bacterium]|nr:insulinase family protein [Gemmatimonadota bacterium]